MEKIEENAKFIERERSKVSFSLNDDKLITAWETNIKTKGTPLLTYFENWNKVNRIQKRKKITKNDELAGELPMIKRPKISEQEINKPKIEHKGPLVLFPSDSEDENDHFGGKDENEKEEKPKAKKKKKDSKKKKVIKKKSDDNDDKIIDKDDIVQDFSVSEW